MNIWDIVTLSGSVPLPGGMLASGDFSWLAYLVAFAFFALMRWLKNRQEGAGNEDVWSDPEEEEQTPRRVPPPRPTPSPAAPPQTPRNKDWEEELRRVLQGQNHPAPPPPVPPPLPRSAEQGSGQPGLALPPVFGAPKVSKAHCANCDGHIEFPSALTGEVILCPHCHQPTELRPFIPTAVETMIEREELTSMRKVDEHFEQATQVEARMESHFREVFHQPVGQTHAQVSRRRAPEVERVVSALKSPRTAREVVVATMIFSPPKALER